MYTQWVYCFQHKRIKLQNFPDLIFCFAFFVKIENESGI